MEIPDDAVELVVRALEHYADYMKATSRDGSPYRRVAEDLQRKPPQSEKGKSTTKRKTG